MMSYPFLIIYKLQIYNRRKRCFLNDVAIPVARPRRFTREETYRATYERPLRELPQNEVIAATGAWDSPTVQSMARSSTRPKVSSKISR